MILEIKKALRVLPKVDVLSPFRVHFTTFGPYCLNLQASCYFATKSLDEFLYRALLWRVLLDLSLKGPVARIRIRPPSLYTH